MLERLSQPWHWSVAGVFIGLIVPTLLIIGNKHFGISSSLRHICAACMPGRVPFFHYDWKKEAWNLFFVGGILLGSVLTTVFLPNPNPIAIDPALATDLAGYGVAKIDGIVPTDLFSFESLFTLRGFLLMVAGGFLVGFGTRYAGGCTSGHAIMGLSNLQWSSLIATISFMVGGFLMTWLLLPFNLQL